MLKLKKLNLCNNKITDLSPLKGLVNLQLLYFSKNQLVALKPLEGLVNLKSLHFSENQVLDIKPLEGLVNLKSLYFAKNQVVDLKPLEGLANLESLYFAKNQVVDLKPLEGLANLESLDFSANQVRDLKPLEGLVNLGSLYLAKNQIKDLTPLKCLTNLYRLDLQDIEVNDLNSLKDLVNLVFLELQNAQIGNFNSLENLSNLGYLILSNTQITDLNSLKNLINLGYLSLSNTQITDLSPLQGLIHLEGLNISNTRMRELNDLKDLIANGLTVHIEGCKMSPLLRDAHKKGKEALVEYIQRPKIILHEARVLVLGEPRAGKTTLRRKLKDLTEPMPEITESTKAFEVEVTPYKATMTRDGKSEKLTYHVWDFGGQEYYRLLHQLFVSEQCVYIIVTDTDRNKNEEEIEFWLETIERLSKDAQGKFAEVVLLQNPKTKREGNDFTTLKKRYPFWTQEQPYVINLNALNKNEKTFQKTETDQFKQFKKYLHELCFKLEHVGMEIFSEWQPIREKLATLKKDYIPIETFRDLCAKKDVTQHSEQDFLLTIFHTLGFLQCYQTKPELKSMVILNREWVTDALYRVLDHPLVRDNKGWFRFVNISEIWHEPKYTDKTSALLGLMQEFKLSYFNPITQKYIVPAKLSEDTDGFPDWKSEQNVHLRLQYEWLPLAITTQLVVSLHEHIVPLANGDHWIWRKGAVIDAKKWQGMDTQVRIHENTKKNYISIRGRGKETEFLIRLLMQKWNEVHEPFKHKAPVNKIIICSCPTCLDNVQPHAFNYDNVVKAKSLNRSLQCNVSFELFSANDIFKGIFSELSLRKDEAIEFLRKGKIAEAFRVLPKKDPLLILLEGRYASLERIGMLRTLDFDKITTETNAISKDLLDYLNTNA